MSDVVPKHELTDEGTRYEHYSDLLEGWRTAEQILKNANQAFATPIDKEKLISIQYAIGLLEKQIKSMAEYTRKVSLLGDLIDTTLNRSKMEKDPEWISYEQATKNDEIRK